MSFMYVVLHNLYLSYHSSIMPCFLNYAGILAIALPLVIGIYVPNYIADGYSVINVM